MEFDIWVSECYQSESWSPESIPNIYSSVIDIEDTLPSPKKRSINVKGKKGRKKGRKAVASY